MKNPFMSLWLSQANTYAGMMRGFWAGEMRRQQNAMADAMTGGKAAKPPAKGKKATGAKRKRPSR